MEQGPVEEKILRDCMRAQLPIPEKIKNAPQLRLGLQIFLSAFMDLSSCRPVGFGLQPIPWTAVHEYCIALGLDAIQVEDMHYFIEQLDTAWLKKNRKD